MQDRRRRQRTGIFRRSCRLDINIQSSFKEIRAQSDKMKMSSFTWKQHQHLTDRTLALCKLHRHEHKITPGRVRSISTASSRHDEPRKISTVFGNSVAAAAGIAAVSIALVSRSGHAQRVIATFYV